MTTKPRRMRWAEHVTGMGENRSEHRVLLGKPEGLHVDRRVLAGLI
jgi:hypothetical protein